MISGTYNFVQGMVDILYDIQDEEQISVEDGMEPRRAFKNLMKRVHLLDFHDILKETKEQRESRKLLMSRKHVRDTQKTDNILDRFHVIY